MTPTVEKLTAELEQTPSFDVPLGKIHSSPYNPRLHFDKEKLAGLATNIKAVGVLQAILLRPHPSKGGDFELVFGERRWRASGIAELPTVPARVRELSTLEVLELQAYENGQRDDVHPLEEADHFLRMHKPPKGADYPAQSIEEIMAKSGKSRSSVFQALKLAELGDVGRKLFLDGKLTKSTADLVARIQPQKLQDKAAREVGRGDEGMSFRAAFDYVKRNFTLTFENCGFDRNDAKLVEKAGPCTTCPKRSGNQMELLGDAKTPDVCLDSLCFKAKQEAAWEIRTAAATEQGKEVLSDKEAKESWPSYEDKPRGFVKLGDHCPDDPKNRTYKQLLGKDAPAVTVARNPHNGQIVEVIAVAEIKKTLKTAGHDFKRAKEQRQSHGLSKAERERQEQRKADSIVRVAALEIAFPEMLGGVASLPKLGHGFWIALLRLAAASGNGLEALRRRGKKTGVDVTKQLLDYANPMTDQGIAALIVEILLENEIDEWNLRDGWPKHLEQLFELAGVDIESHEMSIREGLQPKQPTDLL